MRVVITTPTGLIEKRHIEKVRIDGIGGQFMLKQKHVDMTSSFPPNLMKVWERAGDPEGYYIGLGFGVCVKKGNNIHISSFRVIEGESLEDMMEQLDCEFNQMQNNDAETRKALAYLESSMARYIHRHS